ncbi:DUF3298 and DUF4163 domain-containing protein [Pedobacter cryotolerans]|uniref:DUF3298 and DUF4163 domain-containing protein n=1 Tax=Pedobacter cryotolerans TaxID=2571270 RepID=A0A4U1C8M2_9SPHI|nr:DUF3298 and DUF4163 domain-containing protein [Pedobacter cryotolerans]TKC02676.1 DUF3298 and DUF4163 domain-containing protein [Pedobacter cryotolerans]
MKKLIILLIGIALFASCSNEKKAENSSSIEAKIDTLTYIYDSVKVYSKNIAKAETAFKDTAKATIKYPVFKNEALNKHIQRQVLNYFSDEDPSIISYQEIANSFIRGYDSFFKDNQNTPQSWFLIIDVRVLQQSSNYIALKYLHGDYAGGAHPNSSITFINFNPKTNQPLTLDSLIENDQKPKLLAVAETIFRKNEKLTPTEPLADKYFFDQGKFALAQSFYVNDKGLVFLYNPYEIKAYAYGTTELIIPFNQLQGIAKPNTILSENN